MTELYIDMIPKSILNQLFKLKEVDMFILPKGYIISGKFLNNWRDLLNKKLFKIFQRHTTFINVCITTFNLNSQIVYYDSINIQIKDLENLLINYLQQNIAVSLIINNFQNAYGYLIIPGRQIKREKFNVFNSFY